MVYASSIRVWGSNRRRPSGCRGGTVHDSQRGARPVEEALHGLSLQQQHRAGVQRAGQTDMPQTLVIFAVIAGGAIGGLLGILAAIPLVAALRVVAIRVVAPAVRRGTGAAPALPPTDAHTGAPAD
jgi:hypothetical protein